MEGDDVWVDRLATCSALDEAVAILTKPSTQCTLVDTAIVEENVAEFAICNV